MKTDEKHILIVEDDRAISDLLALYFKTKKYTVMQIFDGVEAFSFVETKKNMRPFLLILLDLLLPGIDGFQILKKLKEQEHTQHIPVIVVSNLGDQKSMQEIARLGAERYIVKANALPKEIYDAAERVIENQKRRL